MSISENFGAISITKVGRVTMKMLGLFVSQRLVVLQ